MRILIHELAWQSRIYVREPMALLYVVAFPLAIVVFQYFRGTGDPAFLLALGVAISVAIANFAGLSISLATSIERGAFTRVYVSPLPLTLHFMARMLAPLGLILVATGLLLLAAQIVFKTDLGTLRPTLLFLALALGTFAFGALGIMLAVLAKRTNRASFLSQLVLFPLFVLEFWAKEFPLLWLSPLHSLLLFAQEAVTAGSGGAALVSSGGILLAWAGLALAVAAKKAGDAL